MNTENKELQESLILVKPGFTQESIVNYIQKRIKTLGLEIVEGSEYVISFANFPKAVDSHYWGLVTSTNPEIIEKYPMIKKYMMSAPIYAFVVRGVNCRSKVREICGSTKNPAPGTIRYEVPHMLGFEPTTPGNVMHASDNDMFDEHTTNAQHEILNCYSVVQQLYPEADISSLIKNIYPDLEVSL